MFFKGGSSGVPRRSGFRFWVTAGAAVAVLVVTGVSSSGATHLSSNTAGHTTVDQTICARDPGSGSCLPSASRSQSSYYGLQLGPGEPYTTRELNATAPVAQAGRYARRRSLLYFGAFSDLHVVDEESPARVEFLDPDTNPAPFAAAWRPQEALQPYTADQAIRQMNRFVDQSPIPQGDGSRARMAFSLVTGDSADNAQLNEVRWNVKLLEGGMIDPNSGSSNPADYTTCPPGTPGPSEAAGYTGVQDYDDYVEGADPAFYDPDDPRGTKWSNWPRYPGLMDRAQAPFQAEGLSVPSYISLGNHEGLAQGNQWVNRSFEDLATGCQKEVAPSPDARDLRSALQNLSPSYLTNLLASDPTKVALVPPDPNRRFVSQQQYRQIYGPPFAAQGDAHGLAYVDSSELSGSNGAASYYAWSPRPGFRFISLNTLGEGGTTSDRSPNGNLDDPQFRWLDSQLQAASDRDEMIVVFAHHAIGSLSNNEPDEAAAQCNPPGTPGADDGHGHDVNPGCDPDPRTSTPIHLGEPGQRPPGDTTRTLSELLLDYPHVIGFVGGHSHVNEVTPYAKPDQSAGFWSIKTSSEIDWFQQSRLLDVMDNRDGTLSIFATDADQGAPTQVPVPGTSAAGFSESDLAALSRTFAYNDPQGGGGVDEGPTSGHNVELLIRDPRRRYPRPGGATPLRVPLVPEFEPCSSPNSRHVGPLDAGSCEPPVRQSPLLTTSTSGKGSASARLDVVPGNPSTAANEADVKIAASATDVRRSDGADYGGRVILSTDLRITDGANGASQSDSGTMRDTPFSIPVDCVTTTDPSIGSACNASTTANSLVPGFAIEGNRAVMSVFSIKLLDAGPDGSIADPLGPRCPPTCGSGDERTFLRQGLFTP